MRTVGVVLAGGYGSRLLPLTKAVSKHLLPVRGQPMLHWPIRTLAGLGVDFAVVVVGGRSCGEIVEHFGSRYETDLGAVSLCYVLQDWAGGLPDAIRASRRVVEETGADRLVVVLGDNVFPDVPTDLVVALAAAPPDVSAFVVKPDVSNPSAYGCTAVRVLPDGRREAFGPLVEKPSAPPPEGSTWGAVLGLYVLPARCFEAIDALRPSARGELEIVDLLQSFLTVAAFHDGPWIDAGEHATYATANDLWMYVRP